MKIKTLPATSRRTFLSQTAGLAAVMAAAGLPTVAAARPAWLRKEKADGASFPKGFFWGAATAAYQVEGAAQEDGRKPSVWDTFSHIPGHTKNGDTGDVACDHYHRYEDDVKLMAGLGIKHYRFSIAWPRIIPDGRGAVNEKGVDFYRRLTDTLLNHGITPHATLFHWDSPQALEDLYGSWRSREIAKDFAEYCNQTVKRLGDRITNWMTMNEIFCFTYLGYGVNTPPQFAPGTIVQTRKELHQTVHHALLAHGMGCQAIRAATPKPAKVSLVINFDSFIPVIETPENIEAAKKAFVAEEHNGTVLVPALTGAYNPDALGADAPDIQPGDMETIAQPLDVLGYNIYTGSYVRAADNARGYELLPLPKEYPQMHMPWLNFVPESLYWGIRMISEALGKKNLPILITENGCATADEVTGKGEILDLARIMYTRSYLRQAHRAISEGYPLIGYFHWSLMDNFEWTWGYTRRFGMTYIDYATLSRTPKETFRWYQNVIRENRLL
ncbi:MAG TPA: GH1 family beta-glucosidase [Candidatus Acidoferrum sp.]|nr:GH1 family beta-glucosidase [Candidatus Acidoferrum sp.]